MICVKKPVGKGKGGMTLFGRKKDVWMKSIERDIELGYVLRREREGRE